MKHQLFIFFLKSTFLLINSESCEEVPGIFSLKIKWKVEDCSFLLSIVTRICLFLQQITCHVAKTLIRRDAKCNEFDIDI